VDNEMAVNPRHLPDDEAIARFLLGTLPEAEAESLDELSIADDDFAARLTAIENDLVDKYVRGALSGSVLTRFESRFLASPAAVEKVRFASALALRTDAPATDRPAADASRPSEAVDAKAALAFTSQRLEPKWMLAAAAVVLLAAGYLVAENVRLRREMAGLRAASSVVEHRAEQLVTQLNAERQAGAETAKELARLRDSVAELGRIGGSAPQPVVATFILTPATRGASGTVVVTLAADAAAVTLQLPLEDDEFPDYDASVIDSSTGASVWRSPRLKARVAGTRKLVSVTVPAALLQPHQYVLELNGLTTSGSPEPVNTFPFRVVKP
jgi:hypothetical protein